jgi:hypothetical protein
MAAEFDPSGVGGYIGTAVSSLIVAVLGTREYMSRKKVGDAADNSAVNTYQSGDKVLDSLVKEVTRLTAEVAKMRTELDEMKDKEAQAKILAIDCYAIASECDCEHERRAELLEKLLRIIKGE